jgi:hypothetical protein
MKKLEPLKPWFIEESTRVDLADVDGVQLEQLLENHSVVGVLSGSDTDVWDVPQAVEYMKKLEPLKPWFIEEPTAPDDAVGRSGRRRWRPTGAIA